MTALVLKPSIELLSEEFVLVQAWKKTASYIRYHNWYSDTLELDRVTVDLPRFLAEVSEQLKAPDYWCNDPLRIVPAPKSQQWHVDRDSKCWEPVERGKTAVKLRPLAHVSFKDQVAATAVMLCLADRVETLQGDPRSDRTDSAARRHVVSYGNRLFCDAKDQELRHRWGSGKLYRAYYQDYKTFLARPEYSAEAATIPDDGRIVIVSSDLRQFYDRVRPDLLAEKLGGLIKPADDPQFYSFARRLLNWNWDRRDAHEVEGYAKQAQLADFSQVALPQGLVAAGFFSNIVLLDFDQELRKSVSTELAPGLRLLDACRYVDDLRIVLSDECKTDLAEIEALVAGWLLGILNRKASGLTPSEDKTIAAVFKGEDRPWVRQSRWMERIQTDVSGGFGIAGGEEILDAVQGLIRRQQRFSDKRTEDQGWGLSPVPDVRDSTVARFAAGRFRSTFRSLRPLLTDARELIGDATEGSMDEEMTGRTRSARTRAELDDEARSFALGLIENWVHDPSNVRLLRIGLDLWPGVEVLRNVLGLLRPFTEKGAPRKAPRRVAWYCLAEIFRAGATETGFVEDGESLPADIDLGAYRSLLREYALQLATQHSPVLPWYLRQQVLLFLAATDEAQPLPKPAGRGPEIKHYVDLIRFLEGNDDRWTGAEFAIMAILSRRSFRGKEAAVSLAGSRISAHKLEQIAQRDPSFALEIIDSRPDLSGDVSARLREDLCLNQDPRIEGWVPLTEVVLQGGQKAPLRNELSLLRFASKFLKAWPSGLDVEAITPSEILLKQGIADGLSQDGELRIVPSELMPDGSMYRPPNWCSNGERWRFHLGFLLRFILSGRQDFTRLVGPPHWKEDRATYRSPGNHWYQRLYALFNGQSAFGDDWLPITDWTERLLSALLKWPGCLESEMGEWVSGGIEKTRAEIDRRILELSERHGEASDLLILPLTAPWPVRPSPTRPLRGCIVQTVIPHHFDRADLSLSDPAVRRQQRNHLSTALAAIDRMLDLRETHKGRDGRLDWLILPELSVHPRDIKTHLLPFARAHKTIILAGLTYEEIFSSQPAVNSALWIIPARSKAHGLQILIRRQGKFHLAPDEKEFNKLGPVVQGFRPCQWLVGYEWSLSDEDQPLWLTAAICYDATDLRLAADLRFRSDVFAIPALNRDISTFDQMAQALHYHMFQMVIVANNGLYGGSNAYAPYKEPYLRQVFHLHGQPQATMAFFEIDDISFFKARIAEAKRASTVAVVSKAAANWKYPPAGHDEPGIQSNGMRHQDSEVSAAEVVARVDQASSRQEEPPISARGSDLSM